MAIASSPQDLPLAVNLIGPMAFKKNDKLLEIWLPRLSRNYPHQAAVGTNVDSYVLGDVSDYYIDHPNPGCHPGASSHHNPPPDHPSVPFETPPKIYPPSSYYVHLTLPRPQWIVGLSPVSCKVYEGNTPPADFEYMPVGFRLLYERAGSPVLTATQTSSLTYTFKFDPAPDEKQLEMFIAYSPYNFSDYNHVEAKDDFTRLAGMFGLKLNVDFEFPFMTGRRSAKRTKRKSAPQRPNFTILNGPAKDCKSPSILLK
jgi:hypothetical protein